MTRIAAQLWAQLTDVPATSELEKRARGRFLANLIVVFWVSSAVIGLWILPYGLRPGAPSTTATFQSGLGLTVLLPGVFLLNRAGYRQLSAASLIGIGQFAVIWAAQEEGQLLSFLILMQLLALALFPLRVGIAVGGVGILSLVVLYSTDPIGLSIPFTVNLFFFALMVVVHLHYRDLEGRRLAELRAREQWFSTTLNSIGDAVLTVDPEANVSFMNGVAEALTGWNSNAAIGRPVHEIFVIRNEHTGEPVESPVDKVLSLGTIVGLANHTELIARDGSRRPIADSGAPITDESGTRHGVVLVFRDMTEEHALQDQLRHSQRLDALGQLAGGVAHDFNNLLTVIGASVDFAVDDVPDGHSAREELKVTLEAVDRAVALTRQLLAFSRRQVMQRQAVDLNAAVAGAQGLLRRLLPDDVSVESRMDQENNWVLVDAMQLEQVLLNLAINAGDAMPNGGTLRFETRVETFESDLPMVGMTPRTYGLLAVTDTGSGISKEHLTRVFEPFFTTKSKDRGNGLGLATVHGIVQQSDGAIKVESTLGAGTTFTIYLPTTAAAGTSPAQKATEPVASADGAVRTAIVVEDDNDVRRLAAKALSRAGFQVEQAATGEEALNLLQQCQNHVSLLITDIVMPGMHGGDVAKAFRETVPALPVVFMSGYADEVIARDGLGDGASEFLGKPFTPSTLVAAVNRALASTSLPPTSRASKP